MCIRDRMSEEDPDEDTISEIQEDLELSLIHILIVTKSRKTD